MTARPSIATIIFALLITAMIGRLWTLAYIPYSGPLAEMQKEATCWRIARMHFPPTVNGQSDEDQIRVFEQFRPDLIHKGVIISCCDEETLLCHEEIFE